MNLTARKAWELSMLKWEFFSTFDYASVYDMVETVDELEDAFPQLIKLFANCGFCEKYIDEDKTEACSRCGKCPIYKSDPEQSAEFAMKARIEFIKALHAKVKQVNPAWISYINAGLMHSHASSGEMREMLSYNDMIGTEGGFQFYGPPKDSDIWHCGIQARIVEATAEIDETCFRIMAFGAKSP